MSPFKGAFSPRILFLSLVGISMCFPFIWMLSASFKPRAEVENPELMPRTLTFDNYPVVLDQKPDPISKSFLGMRFGRWYFNSVLVALGICWLQVFTSALAAYAFSRLNWKGRDKVFLLYLATMMIPGVVTMIPNFKIMVGLDLLNSYMGLIIPAAFTTFGTFMLRQFMVSIPVSLDEAAKIDGASHWDVFSLIILPLTRSGLVALGILAFLAAYQSFLWPLIMLTDEKLYTLPVGLLQLDSTYGRQTEYIMAAAVMTVVPVILVFISFQKSLVKGLQQGGVKG